MPADIGKLLREFERAVSEDALAGELAGSTSGAALTRARSRLAKARKDLMLALNTSIGFVPTAEFEITDLQYKEAVHRIARRLISDHYHSGMDSDMNPTEMSQWFQEAMQIDDSDDTWGAFRDELFHEIKNALNVED